MATLTLWNGARSFVRARRAIFGPRRPSWSEELETLAALLQAATARIDLVPLSWQRRTLGRSLAGRSTVTSEAVRIQGLRAEWLSARASDTKRVLLYLHGGGYSLGSIESHRRFISLLVRLSGVRALAVDYRLAPEHRFPAQLDDALAAYAWLLDGGVAPERIVIAGESAGGGLTLSTLVALRDRGLPLPAGAALISPWLDLSGDAPSVRDNARYDYVHRRALRLCARRLVRPHELRHPLASPLFADLRGLPPMLVQAGGAEALLDDSTRLKERADQAGVRVELRVAPDMIHAYPLLGGFFPEARDAVKELAAFIDARTAAAGTRQAAGG